MYCASGYPFTSTSPAVGFSSPAMRCSNVVFPEPLFPTMAICCPGSKANELAESLKESGAYWNRTSFIPMDRGIRSTSKLGLSGLSALSARSISMLPPVFPVPESPSVGASPSLMPVSISSTLRTAPILVRPLWKAVPVFFNRL